MWLHSCLKLGSVQQKGHTGWSLEGCLTLRGYAIRWTHSSLCNACDDAWECVMGISTSWAACKRGCCALLCMSMSAKWYVLSCCQSIAAAWAAAMNHEWTSRRSNDSTAASYTIGPQTVHAHKCLCATLLHWVTTLRTCRDSGQFLKNSSRGVASSSKLSP